MSQKRDHMGRLVATLRFAKLMQIGPLDFLSALDDNSIIGVLSNVHRNDIEVLMSLNQRLNRVVNLQWTKPKDRAESFLIDENGSGHIICAKDCAAEDSDEAEKKCLIFTLSKSKEARKYIMKPLEYTNWKDKLSSVNHPSAVPPELFDGLSQLHARCLPDQLILTKIFITEEFLMNIERCLNKKLPNKLCIEYVRFGENINLIEFITRNKITYLMFIMHDAGLINEDFVRKFSSQTSTSQKFLHSGACKMRNFWTANRDFYPSIFWFDIFEVWSFHLPILEVVEFIVVGFDCLIERQGPVDIAFFTSAHVDAILLSFFDSGMFELTILSPHSFVISKIRSTRTCRIHTSSLPHGRYHISIKYEGIDRLPTTLPLID